MIVAELLDHDPFRLRGRLIELGVRDLKAMTTSSVAAQFEEGPMLNVRGDPQANPPTPEELDPKCAAKASRSCRCSSGVNSVAIG